MVDWLKRLPLKSKGPVDPLSLCICVTIDVVFGLVGLYCLGAAIFIEAVKGDTSDCYVEDNIYSDDLKILLAFVGIVFLFVILPLGIISVRYKVNRLVWAYAVIILLLLVVQILLAILFFDGLGCFGDVQDPLSVLISSIGALFLFEAMCVMAAIFVAVKTKRYPALV